MAERITQVLDRFDLLARQRQLTIRQLVWHPDNLELASAEEVEYGVSWNDDPDPRASAQPATRTNSDVERLLNLWLRGDATTGLDGS